VKAPVSEVMLHPASSSAATTPAKTINFLRLKLISLLSAMTESLNMDPPAPAGAGHVPMRTGTYHLKGRRHVKQHALVA
jgi:hypothetical protein